MRILLVTVLFGFLVENTHSNSTQSTYCFPVGTKRFCAENTVYRTWFAAVEYCKSKGTGWILASIDDQAEKDALENNYDANLFSGDYWLYGRDSQARSQLVWDTDSTATPKTLGFVTWVTPKIKPDYQSCLVYASLPNSGSGGTLWPCANQLAVLCQKT